MKKIIILLFAALLPAVAFCTPVTIKTSEAIAMRDAITSVLHGQLTITPGAKDSAPVVAYVPFDIGSDTLIALAHDKHAINAALSDLDDQRSAAMTANGITGRTDDTRDAVAKANAAWAAALKKIPNVTLDLDTVTLDGLNVSKNKFNNDDIFDALAPILKK